MVVQKPRDVGNERGKGKTEGRGIKEKMVSNVTKGISALLGFRVHQGNAYREVKDTGHIGFWESG